MIRHIGDPTHAAYGKMTQIKLVLGHNRLSIVELSEAGAQPMVSSDGSWVISYNGELYNYKNLRQKLINKFGVIFKGNSDTEVFFVWVYLFWD